MDVLNMVIIQNETYMLHCLRRIGNDNHLGETFRNNFFVYLQLRDVCF